MAIEIVDLPINITNHFFVADLSDGPPGHRVERAGGEVLPWRLHASGLQAIQRTLEGTPSRQHRQEGPGCWEIYGKYMGNLWEIYGKYMGNLWEIYGKSMGNL